VAWLGARFRLKDVTFQEPEIEDVIRRIYEEGLLLGENEMAGQCVQAHEQEILDYDSNVIVYTEDRHA
jgi:SOS response regulatory protein OraA/RecX